MSKRSHASVLSRISILHKVLINHAYVIEIMQDLDIKLIKTELWKCKYAALTLFIAEPE